MKTLTISLLSILLIFIFVSYIFEDFETKYNENNDLAYYRGKNAYNAQQYVLAQKYFSDDLLTNPERSDSLYLAANSYMKGSFQSFNKSIDYYRKYINQLLDFSLIDISLINQMKNVGMIEDLEKLSNHINNQFYLAVIWEGIDSNKAIYHLDLVPKSDQNLNYHLVATRINFTLKNYSAVVSHAKNVNSISGMHKNNYYLLSQAYRNIQKFREAKEALQIYDKLNSIENEISIDKKFEHITTLYKLNNNLINSYDYNALKINLLVKLNRIKQAEIELKKLSIKSLNKKNRILILEAIKNTRSLYLADYMFSASKSVKITSDEYVLYCQTYILSNQSEKGLDLCANSAHKYPHSAPNLYWFGMALLKSNKTHEAKYQLNNAIDYAPWVNVWIIQLAKLYLLEGNVEFAKAILNKSINQDNSIQIFKLNNSLF